MNSDQCYHLQWNDHKETLVSVIEKHLCSAYLVDCTLYSEGQCLKAHKLILSACSPFFEKVFKENPDKNPIIILNEVKFQELKYIVDYMYSGILEVTGEELGPLLNAAESLQIKGLGNPNEQTKKRKLSNDHNVAQNIVQQFLSQACGYPPSQLDASFLSSQNSSEQPTENPQRENGSRRVNLLSKLTEDSQNTQCVIHEDHKICKIDETWLKSEASTSNKSISNITLSTANTELQSKLSLYDNSWPTSVLLFPVPNGAEDVYSADMIPKSELSPDKTKENNESESVVQLDDSGLEDAHIEFVPDPGSIPECEQNKELGHIQDLQQKHLEDVLSTSIIINDTQVAGPSPNIESSSTGSVTKSNSGNEKRKKKSSVTKRKDGLQLLNPNNFQGERRNYGEEYKCFQCSYSTSKADLLQDHLQMHSGVLPFGAKTPLAEDNLKIRHNIDTKELFYVCKLCGKMFSHSASLSRHKKVHTKDRSYFCTECGKFFTQQTGLNRHKRIHTAERPFSCTECGKSFSQNGNLTRHKKLHSGIRPFSCTRCDKRFSQKIELKRHTRTHTGERPFSCDICGLYFKNLSHVKTHKKIHAK